MGPGGTPPPVTSPRWTAESWPREGAQEDWNICDHGPLPANPRGMVTAQHPGTLPRRLCQGRALTVRAVDRSGTRSSGAHTAASRPRADQPPVDDPPPLGGDRRATDRRAGGALRARWISTSPPCSVVELEFGCAACCCCAARHPAARGSRGPSPGRRPRRLRAAAGRHRPRHGASGHLWAERRGGQSPAPSSSSWRSVRCSSRSVTHWWRRAGWPWPSCC